MKINSNSPALFTGAFLVGGALVLSGLAAGGLLGKSAHVFMHSTLPNVPTSAWIGIGVSTIGSLLAAGTIVHQVKNRRNAKKKEIRSAQESPKMGPKEKHKTPLPETKATTHVERKERRRKAKKYKKNRNSKKP